MDEEPNHEEEIRKIYEDFVNGNYEYWHENKGTILPIARRIFFEEPKKEETKELTPLQIEFKEKCKKYPIIAVFTEYNGETPYFVGLPKFVKVREIDEDDETDTLDDCDECNFISLDELDIEPSHGGYPKTLPICEIINYDEINKCYNWGESIKIKFYQEV